MKVSLYFPVVIIFLPLSALVVLMCIVVNGCKEHGKTPDIYWILLFTPLFFIFFVTAVVLQIIYFPISIILFVAMNTMSSQSDDDSFGVDFWFLPMKSYAFLIETIDENEIIND